MDVPLLKVSPTMYLGLVNPDVDTVNVSFVPGITAVPGEMDWIETDAGGETVIVCVVLALLPMLSEDVIKRTCVPTSVAVGVQENLPPPEMLLPLTDVEAAPAKESDNKNSVPEKPEGTIVNMMSSRAGIVVPGEMF